MLFHQNNKEGGKNFRDSVAAAAAAAAASVVLPHLNM
jgi:hypothetical protein